MSKMKHLLRKLHIGGSGSLKDNNRLTAAARPSVETTSFNSSSSSSSSPSPIIDGSGNAAENSNSNSTVDSSSFFEEEFQMQLALAISSSSSSGPGQPDSESAHIRAAKQRSLGCPPSDSSLVNNDFLSLRYWSNNVVNYDEKVMDGFYDVYGITSNSITQGKMPLLVDLQAITVSDSVDFEVILVDRMVDKELRSLEERVSSISLECHAAGTRQIMSTLIQKIANIVVDQMGGPVSDADDMLSRWAFRSYELRNSMNTIILPLGCLDVGLSRHRALLFKVLADKINLPCSLVKGSYYTGTDDGAVNLIKIDNGSEYIIDLMGAPGTLIPAEVQSFNLPGFGYPSPSIDVAMDSVSATPQPVNVTKAGISGSEVASFMDLTKSSQLKGHGGKVLKKNHTERFEYDFGELLPSLSRSHEGPSGAGGRTSPAQKLQVNDVSNCVISAAKNPGFAQKLHAVLLNNQEDGETQVCETVHLLDVDMLNAGDHHGPALIMSNNELNVHSDYNANLIVAGLPAEQEIMPQRDNIRYSLPSKSASESRSSALVHDANSKAFLAVKPLEMQKGEGFAGFAPSMLNKAGRAHKDDERTKKLDMNLMETSSICQPKACMDRKEGISRTAAEWEIKWEDIQIEERIGIGSYGEVYRSEWNGTEVAVKKFMNQDISGDALNQYKGEVEIMLRLRHPNVVLFMGAVTHPPNLSILTEFLPRIIRN